MLTKNLDLELTIKDGKIKAKADAPGVKLDLTIDVKAAGASPTAIWDQLAAVAFSLAQGCAQASDMKPRKRQAGKAAPRAKA